MWFRQVAKEGIESQQKQASQSRLWTTSRADVTRGPQTLRHRSPLPNRVRRRIESASGERSTTASALRARKASGIRNCPGLSRSLFATTSHAPQLRGTSLPGSRELRKRVSKGVNPFNGIFLDPLAEESIRFAQGCYAPDPTRLFACQRPSEAKFAFVDECPQLLWHSPCR